jgi:hypothetical protein
MIAGTPPTLLIFRFTHVCSTSMFTLAAGIPHQVSLANSVIPAPTPATSRQWGPGASVNFLWCYKFLWFFSAILFRRSPRCFCSMSSLIAVIPRWESLHQCRGLMQISEASITTSAGELPTSGSGVLRRTAIELARQIHG